MAAALREAAEEVGVDPGDVDVVATLPELFIPPTGFRVVPVLAWWRQPRAVAPIDPAKWLLSTGSASASWPIPQVG